jgi:hypothetical protein
MMTDPRNIFVVSERCVIMRFKRNKEERGEIMKERYEKPKLMTIDLKAEEVLTTGCKMEGGAPSSSPFGPCVVTCQAGSGS